ncbi:MAG: 50S ribosomal protein L13 [bacterium]|nr:50S ribosomal protein L13 [bacterium]
MEVKTRAPKKEELVKKWHLVDAKGQILGRVATQVAKLLIGKDKPTFVAYLDCGDKVVVVNAAAVAVSAGRSETKIYKRHSGYPGGLRLETLKDLLARRPEEVIRRAVWGMLPNNRLRAVRITNLYIYAGAEHPHQAQLGHRAQLDNPAQLKEK